MMRSTVQIGLDWWGTWQEQSINRRIFAAMVTVGGFTVLVKLAAVAKEMAIAYQFGTSDELDAFLIAVLLPQFAVSIIGGSLNSAMIPTYIQVREQEGRQAAQRLLSSVMLLSIGLIVALTVILALAAPYIISLVASGFTPEKLALAQALYYVLLVTLVLNGISTTWGAVLNAENRFALAAVAPMGTSILTIAAVVIMAKQWGSYAIVVGIVCGALIEAGVLGWGLMRTGGSLIPRWSGVSPAVRQVLGQYAPMVAAGFLMNSAAVVSQSMAAMLGPGSVSALAYGSKVTNLMLGIGAMAVSTAVLPHFSSMVAVTDWKGLRHTLHTYSYLILIVTVPLTAGLIYFSESVIALLFQRGAFTEADSHLAGQVQAMLLLQVPLFTVGTVFVRLISALKANHVMLWGNAVNLVVCVVLTYVLMERFGVEGIALATSTMYFVSVLFLALIALRLLKGKSSVRVDGARVGSVIM